MAQSIRSVWHGHEIPTPQWADAVDADGAFVRTSLTRREIEVLRLYASGETAERVGAALGISRETVYDHVRRIRGKYASDRRNARTKLDLHRRAVEDGHVAGPDQ